MVVGSITPSSAWQLTCTEMCHAGYAFGCALSLFSYVLFSLWAMAASALRVTYSGGGLFQLPSKRLGAFLCLAIGSWLFFPSTIFAGKAGLLKPATVELILIYANFAAKVGSVAIFLTCQICMRRLQEQAHRVQERCAHCKAVWLTSRNTQEQTSPCIEAPDPTLSSHSYRST